MYESEITVHEPLLTNNSEYLLGENDPSYEQTLAAVMIIISLFGLAFKIVLGINIYYIDLSLAFVQTFICMSIITYIACSKRKSRIVYPTLNL